MSLPRPLALCAILIITFRLADTAGRAAGEGRELPPLLAQAQKNKGPDPDDIKIRRLQQQLKEKERRIDQLEAQLRKERVNDPDDDKIRQLQQQLRDRDQKLDRLGADLKKAQAAGKDGDSATQARYVHTMILRLKTDAPRSEVKALMESAPKTLGKLPGVRGVWLGKPAAVASDGAQSDYQVGVVLLFDDADGLSRFLNSPAQKKFSEGLKKSWDTPTVYDFQQ